MLLESSEIDSKKKLESMIIIEPSIRISCINKTVTLEAYTYNGKKIIQNLEDSIFSSSNKDIKIKSNKKKMILFFPNIIHQLDEEEKLNSISIFESIRYLIKGINYNKNSDENFDQKFCNKEDFFGGLFSYDLISNFEPVSHLNKNKKTNCPDFCFYLSEILLLLNHQKKTCVIQSNTLIKDTIEINKLKKKIDTIKSIVKSIVFSSNYSFHENEEKNKKTLKNEKNLFSKSNYTDQEFIKKIKIAKKLIKSGEIFQIVLSRKFYLPCDNPIVSYNKLKRINPSPYMFFMKDQNFILFGTSPESSLKYNPKNREIEIHPIAGTRPRGKNQDGSLNFDLDNKIELEMRNDKKEICEHLMLVDLARNDLAKICSTGTRYVSNFMKVDKYSHVMHLVSKVVGKLKSNLDIFHAYQACMNMGTLTGSPKVRAMQIIEEQNEQRGAYGGSIGYFTASYEFDTCIIIRSAYVVNDIATVQAGAGIVFDSIPEEEVIESKNKAHAVLSAINFSNNN